MFKAKVSDSEESCKSGRTYTGYAGPICVQCGWSPWSPGLCCNKRARSPKNTILQEVKCFPANYGAILRCRGLVGHPVVFENPRRAL